MSRLGAEEVDLIGRWEVRAGRVVGDATCQRIEELVAHHLVQLGSRGVWEVLFRDPDDGRYWELTYPDSHLHGGGPPGLTAIPNAEARARFGVGD